jgi:hypothetical protein
MMAEQARTVGPTKVEVNMNPLGLCPDKRTEPEGSGSAHYPDPPTPTGMAARIALRAVTYQPDQSIKVVP